jgi:hypothetical protein
MSSEPEHISEIFASPDQLQHIDELIAESKYTAALAAIEQIPVAARAPLLLSAYALCIAEVKGAFKTSVQLCHDAIKKDPKNAEHYFRQGRILLLANRKKDAIWVLRMGLRHGRHKGIIDTLGSLGIRRPPPIQFLARSNPVNKFLGMLLTRLNLR